LSFFSIPFLFPNTSGANEFSHLKDVVMPLLKSQLPLNRLALSLTLAGVLLGVLIAMVGRAYEHNFTMHGYGVFVAFSLAAIVLGIVTRSSPLGKTAAIASSILLVGSVAILG